MTDKKALLIVISGPAGSGKGTVVNKIIEKDSSIGLSVSATTRQPRPGEKEGISYFFITKDEFERRIADGDILEHTVYCGNYYGTPKSELMKNIEAGRDMILEIEVDGGSQIKKAFPDAVTVMLVPPTKESLRARLTGRGTETPEVIDKRLKRAEEEIKLAEKYDYVVVNGDGDFEECVSACADDIIAIVKAEHAKSARMKGLTEHFFDN